MDAWAILPSIAEQATKVAALISKKTMLKALPTIYNGQQFKSRLEGRWAFYLDGLSVPWQYEHEAYDLGGLVYVPDFWLPNHNAWLEAKGEIRNDQIGVEIIQKCTKLATLSAYPVILAFNDPLHQRCAMFGVKGGMYTECHFSTCLICGGFGVSVRIPTGARFLCPNGKGHQPASIQEIRTARDRAFSVAIEAKKHSFSISRRAA